MATDPRRAEPIRKRSHVNGSITSVKAVEGLIYDDETPVREKARKILKTLKPPR